MLKEHLCEIFTSGISHQKNLLGPLIQTLNIFFSSNIILRSSRYSNLKVIRVLPQYAEKISFVKLEQNIQLILVGPRCSCSRT
jgi:hypothetical protein